MSKKKKNKTLRVEFKIKNKCFVLHNNTIYPQ